MLWKSINLAVDSLREPIHVHIAKGSANGKIWLEPTMQVDFLIGFSNAEEKDILNVVTSNLEQFKKKWNEYFSK
jgi:hypothetical protein